MKASFITQQSHIEAAGGVAGLGTEWHQGEDVSVRLERAWAYYSVLSRQSLHQISGCGCVKDQGSGYWLIVTIAVCSAFLSGAPAPDPE